MKTKTVPHSEIGLIKSQLNTEGKRLDSWKHQGWAKKGPWVRGKTRMPRCWTTLGSERTACACVDGVKSVHLVERRVELRHVWAEGVQVAPCTRSLLRRDRAAVAVVYDDVLKRLVHAQENARLYSSVRLEGRSLWSSRRT